MTEPVAFTATSAGSGSGGGRPNLVHAFLELRTPPIEKGSLTPGTRCGRIEFQFNPKELTVTKSAKWSRDPQRKSKSSGVPEFKGAEPCKLAVEMFLAATDSKDASVVKTVEQLFACCVPTTDSHKSEKPSPPWVIFHWGDLTGFTAYIASVAVKYTLFTPGGMPIRATATVNLEEMAKAPKGQNPTSGALAAHRLHTVVAGDSLQSIAWREYGDPTMWRAVAERNNIEDPMQLPAGTALLVPSAGELTG